MNASAARSNGRVKREFNWVAIVKNLRRDLSPDQCYWLGCAIVTGKRETLMLRMAQTVCIDAPASAVWAVLSDLESIHLWVEAIRHSHCPDQRRGVGALRVCELSQATIHETVVEWEEGRAFKYRGEGAPMMKTASNRWSVEAHGEQTLVTSSAEVVAKGGSFGLLLELFMRPVVARMGVRSLASLKYFVEHGHPYPGRVRELGPAPSAC